MDRFRGIFIVFRLIVGFPSFPLLCSLTLCLSTCTVTVSGVQRSCATAPSRLMRLPPQSLDGIMSTPGLMFTQHTISSTQRARPPRHEQESFSVLPTPCAIFFLSRTFPSQRQKLAFLISLKLFFVPFNEVAVKFSFRWVCSCMRSLYLSPKHHRQHISDIV